MYHELEKILRYCIEPCGWCIPFRIKNYWDHWARDKRKNMVMFKLCTIEREQESQEIKSVVLADRRDNLPG